MVNTEDIDSVIDLLVHPDLGWEAFYAIRDDLSLRTHIRPSHFEKMLAILSDPNIQNKLPTFRVIQLMYEKPPVIPTDSPLDPDGFNALINYIKEMNAPRIAPIRFLFSVVLRDYPSLINQKVLHNVIEFCLNPDYNELNQAYPRHHRENENYREIERFGLNVFKMYLKSLKDPHHLKTTIPLIVSKLSHENETIRISATQYIWILTRNSSKRFLKMINETLPTLHNLIEDPNPGVRSIALDILESIERVLHLP